MVNMSTTSFNQSTDQFINNLAIKLIDDDEEKQQKSFVLNFGVSLEPEIDDNGFPILPDKSKYKAVAMEYCQKMGWQRPLETTQCVDSGYTAIVTFGEPGKAKSESGNGLRQKDAIY